MADTESFTKEWVIEGVDPKTVYAAWMDGEYHACMTASPSSGNPGEVGGEFTAWNGFISGKTLEANPKKTKFKQEWSTQAFPDGAEPSILEVKLVPLGKKKNRSTKVELSHSNIPAGQGANYLDGWRVKYEEPMAEYFDPTKTTFASHVHPHDDEFKQISENFWFIAATFMGDLGKAWRNMTVYRMPSGGLFIHGPCALFEPQMEMLEALGPIEVVYIPNPLHRADSGVFKRRYPDAAIWAPTLAVPKAEEYGATPCGTAMPGEEIAAEWEAAGIKLREIPIKEGFELAVEFDLNDGRVALVFSDSIHNDVGVNHQPNKYLFGCEFCVPRACGLPVIGFMKNKAAMQQWLLELIDEYTEGSETYGGKTLGALFSIHGPPSWEGAQWEGAEAITDPMVALRKVARSSTLPTTLKAEEGVVISGFMEKQGARFKSWKRRFAILREDGGLTYHVDDTKTKIQGEVELYPGSVAAATDDSDGHDHCLEITCPGRANARRWLFAFDDDAQRDAWIEAINQAVERKTQADVLAYWFQAVHEGDDTPLTLNEHAAFWFFRSKHVDTHIRSYYAALFDRAIAGELDWWVESDEGLVALIILLDQFGRNIHRDTPRMYEGDAKALGFTREAIASGRVDTLPLYQRLWFSLVLQRAEDTEVAAESVAFAEALAAAAASTPSQVFYERSAQAAHEQAELCNRFGRYPNRNEILDRESTEDEVAYLTSDEVFYST